MSFCEFGVTLNWTRMRVKFILLHDIWIQFCEFIQNKLYMYVLENRKKKQHLKFNLRIFSVYIHGPRMQRNFTGSKISTLNGSKYIKSWPPSLCFPGRSIGKKNDRPTSDWQRHFCAPESKAQAPVVGIYTHPSDINVSHLWVFWRNR